MPENLRWRVRDTVAAAALFLGTAAFTFWQNTRVAVLWDLSYLLDTAWRFALGQVPYRDLPFSYAPLTFLLHAGIIRIFGRVYYPHLILAALEAGAVTVLTWRLLMWTGWSRGWVWATVLASPLVMLGIYGIYPHPIYDSEAMVAVVVAMWLLLRAEESRSRVSAVLAGAACVLPLFFKQNIGLAFLGGVAAYLAVAAAVRIRRRGGVGSEAWVITSVFGTLGLALVVLGGTVGLRNYLYWTVTYAARQRLPGLPVLLSAYRQEMLVWSIPAAIAGIALLRNRLRVVGLGLLAAPFVWTVISFALWADAEDRADHFLALWPHVLILAAAFAVWKLRPSELRDGRIFPALLPIVLLATIHGTFLSQQLWGSTYAIWPLLVLLIGGMLGTVPEGGRWLGATVTGTLLVCGGIYAGSLERLDYIHMDGPVARASLAPLRGMATPGPWIPRFEALVRFAEMEIPAGDGTLLIPGEVPFYFATGRTPTFPILLFDATTDPYTPEQTRELARARDIRWVIVDRELQLNGEPIQNLPQITDAVLKDYSLYRRLPGYDVYRRKLLHTWCSPSRLSAQCWIPCGTNGCCSLG